MDYGSYYRFKIIEEPEINKKLHIETSKYSKNEKSKAISIISVYFCFFQPL